MRRIIPALGVLATLSVAAPAAAQVFPTGDAVLKRIWDEGTQRSRVYTLSQTLLDSIGPRLTGSPGQKAAHDWAVAKYEGWGIPARNEQYGTWRGWRRGITHADLVAPRVRSLEATMLAWSPGTEGPVQGAVVAVPDVADAAAFRAWLPQAKGKFVLISAPEPTCRPDENWEKFARPATLERMREDRKASSDAWRARLGRLGVSGRDLVAALENAGAAGILTSRWSNGWGVNKVFGASSEKVPSLDVSCEDYGLLFRLAENGQGPVLRIEADAEFQGEVPVFNTIAEIRGTEKPDEYVVLSAHFDSWDAGSGATDNGTGTVTMMEAMRILKQVYPNPKRTILVGHWSGEEQGLNGSRAFAKDHPEVVRGLQALFNQDNGTGRVQTISMQGIAGAGPSFARWISAIPTELSREIRMVFPGTPAGGGSDYAAFVCYGAPAFSLSSLDWDYRTYTWHTNRDTFDKVVLDDVRDNAVLTAMLAYLASEDEQTTSRERVVELPRARNGQAAQWPTCRDGARTSAGR